MQTQNLQVDAVSTINYQFTAIPTNLFYLLDNNSRTILFTLIQSSTYYAKEDGFFYITKEAIGELTNLSVNVITAAIDTLYINNLVQVTTVGKSKGKYVNHYKVNFEEFIKFEDMTFEDLKNPLNKIESVKYKNNYQPQYIKDYLCNQVCKQERKQERKKVITNIDNINNIENKDNIKNKNNINIYTSNILEENSEEIGLIENPISENNKEENNLNIKEVGFVDNPTSDKIEIENNNTFQLCEVGMLEKEETNNTPTMNAKFNYYFNDCIKRMGDGVTTIVQLNEKIEKLSTWVRNHNNCYTNEEYTSIQEVTLNKYMELKEQLESESIEDTSIEDEFFNNKEEKVETAKEQLLPNVRIALTKEQLIEDLIEYKNTIINQENLVEAKGYFKQYIKSKDKLIIEFGLTPMVEDIFKELDAKINANKADLTTFNLQDKESIIEDEKTQENAGKQVIIGYKVEEEIPF